MRCQHICDNVCFGVIRERRAGGSRVSSMFCVSVFPHDISKTDAARITKLDTDMLYHESRKPVYFGVKRSRSRGTKRCRRGSYRSSECWFLLVLCCFDSLPKSTVVHFWSPVPSPSMLTALRMTAMDLSPICHLLVYVAAVISWSLTFLFSTNMAPLETKGQGWRAIPTQ